MRKVLSAMLLLALAACSTLPAPAPPSAEREQLFADRQQRLGLLESWAIEGKLAVTDGKDGGSGHFQWERGIGRDHMDFHGALGRGAWRLDAGPDGVELELANGDVFRSASLDELVRRHAGWSIPVDYLAWWVRGLAAPVDIGTRALDESGRLVELWQAGWVIVFDRYRSFDGIDLPVRLTATRDDARVRLAVRHWTVRPRAGGGG